MSNEQHLKILRQGIEVWNQWRKKDPEGVPDLENADLEGMNLAEALLDKTNLTGAILTGADLTCTSLWRANLTGAILTGAKLGGAILIRATLVEANLVKSGLWEANLTGTTLINTDFSEARLRYTVFGNIDLRGVKGMETVRHQGPSIVDIHTLVKSNGLIPDTFLRGIGAPDSLIEYAHSLATTPIQYYSCFISYSSRDQAFATRLYADLQSKGIRCWFAPEDMKIGDKIRARIDEAIHLQDKLLLLLSEHAIASPWVEDEVEAALEKEQRQQREVLFPVRIDECMMQTTQPWATKLRRTRDIGDFTKWTDPQAYQQAFERLLRDLKA